MVPNLIEASNVLVWRQADATKNALNLAAQQFATSSELLNKDKEFKHELLYKNNINFNNYPIFFKRGSFIKRVKKESFLTNEQLEAIPQQYRPKGAIEKSLIEVLYFLPPLNKLSVENRIKLITDDNF